jgi:drug/metabolite transporter (DMT)-like permease
MGIAVTGRAATLKGAGFMVAAAVCYTLETSLIKLIGSDWPAPNQLFWRQTFALFFLLPFVLANPKKAFYTDRPLTMMFRSVMTTSGHFLAVFAFTHLALVTANALSYSRPLWMALLGVVMLREPVRRSRILAAFVGFAGVLIALDPFQINLTNLWPVMAGLGAAFCLAMGLVSIKSMTANHSTFTLLVYAIILGLLLTAPFALMHWRKPTGIELILFAFMGAAHIGSIILYVKGLTAADATLMANFDYTRLVFAILVGVFVFGEWPSLNVWLGVCVIISSLLIVTRRRLSSESA